MASKILMEQAIELAYASIVSLPETWGKKCLFGGDWMAKADRKREALALLAKNISQVRVAEILGINRRTIVRWLKEPEFKAQLLAMRRENLEVALDRLVESSAESNTVAATSETKNEETKPSQTSQIDSLITKAIAALDCIVTCPESRNSDRLRASELILKLLGTDRLVQTLPNSKSLPSSVTRLSEQEREQQIKALLERRQLLQERRQLLQQQKMNLQSCENSL